MHESEVMSNRTITFLEILKNLEYLVNYFLVLNKYIFAIEIRKYFEIDPCQTVFSFRRFLHDTIEYPKMLSFRTRLTT